MSLARGALLGPYEILAHIGAGGMGEVWRARDRRIGRDVAVKVLPESFPPGDERVLRFEQEARAAGALNHPGLVTIFDVGAAEGSPYIVMELLEGQTLRDAIGEAPPSPLPSRKAIDYAMQLAAALATAHEKGIIHRDLKPENIFITSEGHVKILDFGLAKLCEEAIDADGQKTARRPLTSSGMVVGTPGYMSPEQVRAKPLDHRTDIFALGLVLYEMLTGCRAFDRDSAVETMTAILNEEPPPLATLSPQIPPALAEIVQHCMEKNPRDRFQSARDLAFQLRTLAKLETGTGAAAVPMIAAARRSTPAVWMAIIAVLAAAGIGIAFLRGRAGAAPPGDTRTFQQVTFGSGLSLLPSPSPDGKAVAFVSSEAGNRDIFVQRIGARTAVNLTSDSPADDTEPAFSPDGSQIAFRSERDGGGIFLMGVTGESVRRLTNFGHNPSWSPDGAHVVVATEGVELVPQSRVGGSELWIVDVPVGTKHALIRARRGLYSRDSDAVQPVWSPHGKRIAYWGFSNASGQRDLSTIDPNAPRPGETIVPLTSDAAPDWNPTWSPDGKYLYFCTNRNGTMNLWRIAVDEESGKPNGAPEALPLPSQFSVHYAMAQHGELAYAAIARTYRLLAFPFDATTGKTGTPRTVLDGSLNVLGFQQSPDGRSIVLTCGSGAENVFVIDADGKHLRQFTSDAAIDRFPTWSRDGKRVFFYSNRGGAYQVWSVDADGGELTSVTNDADLRRTAAKYVLSPDPAPDGRTLSAQTDQYGALVHLDRPPGQRLEPLGSLDQARLGTFPKWSPDGTRLVAAPHGTHIGDVLPGVLLYSLATRKYEKISDRGNSPQWLPDGKHVVFFEANDIGVIDVDTRRTTIAPFPHLNGVQLDDWRIYPRISRDGKTLYVLQTVEQSDIWIARLQEGAR